MGVEKQSSKGGGGYVGGFFQLFDWNAKSRKKLFPNKSELPERSKLGKKSDENLPMTQLHLIDEDDAGGGTSNKGSGDYSRTSSVTDDEGYGTRAPGVVAKLMGLDSLPTSTSAEPYSTPSFDTQSLPDAHYHRRNLDFHTEYQNFNSRHLLDKVEGPVRSSVESKRQRLLNRPIEKFQTEVLPPRSAKSIPVTHHKLLSPIKSHGFTTSKNAAHIMEAATRIRIIEPGPPATTKAKMPSVGSSSVPLKVRDLREKMEATKKMPMVGSSSVPLKVRDAKEKVETAQKPFRLADVSRNPLESNAAKSLKGQSLNKSWNGSEDKTSFRILPDTEGSSSGVKHKGKSISLAIQAKVNVQRREGLSATRSSVGQKEQSEVRLSQPSHNSQPNIQKSVHKKSSAHNGSAVLKQNNQKQNGPVGRDNLPSKSLVSSSQGRRPQSGVSSFGRQKASSKSVGNSKIGVRKLGLEVTNGENDVSCSSTKNFPQKKRSIERDFHFEKNRAFNNGLSDKSEKPFQPNPVMDKHLSWAEDGRKKGMDVISFTFTAPMTRSMPGSDPSRQVAQKSYGLCTGKSRLHDSPDSRKFSSPLGLNMMGGDDLNILLEQKLRELTNAVESSCHDSVRVGPAANPQHPVPTPTAVSTTQRFHDKGDQHGLHPDKVGSQFSSTDPLMFRTKHKFQGMDEVDNECSNNHIKAKWLLDCQHPSPVSILEPSFSIESCNSSDSTYSNSTEESKQCSSVQAQEVVGLGYLKKLHSVEADIDLSDSASSSLSTRTLARKNRTTFKELEYVKEILCDVEMMFKEFSVGRARNIINPHLFDQLESVEDDGDVSRLRRKVLFDCVGECMDLRCRRYVGGGCKTWAKGVEMVRRKERLAEEVCKEISGWSGMGDCMVDELVDKDMSSPYGRWVEFEVDEFEVRGEIEKMIFNSLVDEVVASLIL